MTRYSYRRLHLARAPWSLEPAVRLSAVLPISVGGANEFVSRLRLQDFLRPPCVFFS